MLLFIKEKKRSISSLFFPCLFENHTSCVHRLSFPCLSVSVKSGRKPRIPCQDSPPGKKRLEGADATHAWVLVWSGPNSGWLGFDPTNAIVVANDHIALAVGRDFSDVSPVYGVFVGSGANELDVKVDVIPISSQ